MKLETISRWMVPAIILVVLLAGCKPAEMSVPTESEPSPTAQATATPTSTATATATATQTPLPTDTPTPTPRPTLTPQPNAASTPSGYQSYEDFGFAFTLPRGWEILDEEDLVYGGSPAANIGMLATSFLSFEGASPTALDDFLDGFFQTVKHTKINKGEMMSTRGSDMELAMVQYAMDDGTDALAEVYHAWIEPREYFVVLFGPKKNMESNQAVSREIIDSFQFGGMQMMGIVRDESLVLSGGGDPLAESMDPGRTQGAAGGYVGLLYSGLVSLSPEMQIVPDLAESWTVSPDGKVYTFKIKPEAYFQSGRPITADDFKYSWERAADPETDSPTAATYLGDILGFEEMNNGETDEVRGIQVLDELTLEVTLDGPKPYFLAKLTYPTSYVVDRDSVNGDPDDWAFKPNASGPYRLKEFIPQSIIIFEPNPANPSPGKIRNLVFQLYLPGKDTDYYQQDEIDIAYVGDPEEIRSMRDPENPLNAELVTTTSMCTSMVLINNTEPPMDDADVRKAFAMAIDREELLDQFSENEDLLAESILPPAMPGYSSSNRASEFNAEEARSLLENSSYGEAMPKIILYDSGYAGDENAYLNFLVSAWEDNLGVDVEVETLEPENFMKLARQGDGHLVSFGWCADYPDPENFLDVLFHSEKDLNLARYSNGEVDVLLEQARVEVDAARRIELYQQIEQMLLADHAAIPLNHSIWYGLVKPYVKGYVLTPLHNRILDKVTIER